MKKAIIPGLSAKAKIWTTLLPILGFVLAVFGALIGVCTDWQMIADEQKAKGYTPSASIKDIADNLQLTRKGKAVFYATHPVLQTSADFNEGCGGDGDGTYTLGCYYKDETSGDERISIYDTDISELNENGFHYDFVADRYTTALHEMLHAVYDRLDSEEKNAVCSNAIAITNEIPGLRDSLSLYPKEHYCSEAYARIGSEYIVALSGHENPTATISRADLSSGAQKAADEMAKQYQNYYSLNQNLAEAHYENIVTKTTLDDYVSTLSKNLDSEQSYVQSMIDSYYYRPTYSNYALANNAISAYNEHLATFKSYYSTYSKIFDILDSETDVTLASL